MILTLSPWSRILTRPLILTTSYRIKIFSVNTFVINILSQIALKLRNSQMFSPAKDSSYMVFPDGQLTKRSTIALHKWNGNFFIL